MALTLADLVNQRDLQLRVHTGEGLLDRPIAWVHTSEIADPTPYLTGGELLLTTGLGLPTTIGGRRDYVRRLVAAGVVGLGFGTGLSHRQVPALLVAAAAEHKLPLIEVPQKVPFIALSKLVASESYAAVTRTNKAQHELARALVGRNSIAGMLRKLVGLIDGSWVMFLDSAGQPVHSFPKSATDFVPLIGPELSRIRRATGSASGNFTAAGQQFAIFSVGGGARSYLVVGSARGFDYTDMTVIHSAVTLLTLNIAQISGVNTAARATLMESLISGEIQVQLIRGDSATLAASLSRDEGVFAAHHGTDLCVLTEPGHELGVESGRIGRSEPLPASQLSEGVRQAWRALDFAVLRRIPVADFAQTITDGLGAYLDSADRELFAKAALAPLLVEPQLLEALRAWLANHGQWDKTAAALAIHRHTLKSRIEKAALLLGRDLDDAGVRAELWLAYLFVRDFGYRT
jgi:purine catabolism regulator